MESFERVLSFDGAQAKRTRTTRIGRVCLEHASADRFLAGQDADASAFEQVCHRGECLAVITAGGADGDDEVTESEAAAGCFKGFFHGENVLNVDLESFRRRERGCGDRYW